MNKQITQLEGSEEYRKKYKEKLDKAFKHTERSAVGFFVKHFRFTYLILIFIIIAGLYSMLTIPREAEPEVQVPFAVVNTIYPGANPNDIEELVTDKIENEVKNLDDLKLYTSSSGQGFSSVFVEFEAEADLKESFRKLREAVDNAENKLPADAETPAVMEINFNDFPIVTYSLVGDYSEPELKKFADILQEKFESIPDVSKAPLIGGVEQEYQIITKQETLANYGLSMGQIVSAISGNNFSLPAGDIEIDNFKYGVRVKGRFESIEDLNDIVVITYENTPIFLRDVAEIKNGFKEKTNESKLGFPGQPSQNTISIQIYKKTGGNILNIVEESQIAIDECYADNCLPDDIKIQKTNDNSVFIKDDLKTLGTSALQTIILINIILMVVLSFRGALITALSVPLAFLMAFIFLYLQGMTLNSMVLFSLVLSLGLMVDNAIVIIEGINEYVTVHGKSIYEAAMLSIWNFKWAITSGTMTTVSAFLPMLLVSGILGEYMSTLPKTISVTLLSSLFVAIVVIPTLATRFIKVKSNSHHSHRTKKRHQHIEIRLKKIQSKYIGFMEKVLPNKKRRRQLIAAAWITFIAAVTIPASGLMKIEMFPDIDLDYFYINIELPVGSTLESNRPITNEVEEIVSVIPEMDNYVTNIGGSAALGFGDSGSSGSHLSSLIVNLVDKDEREKTSYEIADELREKLKNINGADITVDELAAGPPTGSPVEIRIFGDNLKDIDLIAKDMVGFLEKKDDTINVRDTLEEAAGEFTFSVDKQKANYYGLNITQVAGTLRQMLYGITATEMNINGEDVDVTVKFNENDFQSVDDLEKIMLTNPMGQQIPLNEITQIDLEPALLAISHRDGEKVAIVRSDLEPGGNLQSLLNDLNEYIDDYRLPENTSLEIGGEVEDIQKSFRELFLSMGIAVILISFILVLQFNSFKQPFIIIFSVPLAFIGVIFGLLLLGMPFSFTAFIGIVSLAGIVVNDAIVLIDRINKNIRNGMDFYKAIIEGGTARMQPIFLTSITTIAGVFPLIYASELWAGLSISVIFGLIFSTVLTLIMIPIVYSSLCYGEKCKKKEA